LHQFTCLRPVEHQRILIENFARKIMRNL